MERSQSTYHVVVGVFGQTHWTLRRLGVGTAGVLQIVLPHGFVVHVAAPHAIVHPFPIVPVPTATVHRVGWRNAERPIRVKPPKRQSLAEPMAQPVPPEMNLVRSGLQRLAKVGGKGVVVEVGAQPVVLQEIKPARAVVGEIWKQVRVGVVVVVVGVLFVGARLAAVARLARGTEESSGEECKESAKRVSTSAHQHEPT